MKNQFVGLLILLIIIFLVGGIPIALEAMGIISNVFVGFFPLFNIAIKKSLKDYLSSAYFIVGIIIFVASSIGIILSVKQRRVLYFIVSLVLDLVSIFSIINNLVGCS